MKSTFVVRGAYIQLDQLLKVAGLVTTGGEAHAAVATGQVKVDGKLESRKRAKLRAGQSVSYAGHSITLTADQG